MDLLSVFTSEPLFTVRCGQSDLGFVHELSFAVGKGAEKTLLLGGRSWMVTHIDWKRRVAYVEPVESRERSRWLGSGQSMSFELCQAGTGRSGGDWTVASADNMGVPSLRLYTAPFQQATGQRERTMMESRREIMCNSTRAVIYLK